MNLNAINTLISKTFNADKRFMLGHYGSEHIAISTDGVSVYIIPEKLFIFDKDKLVKSGSSVMSDMRKIIAVDGYTNAVKLDTIIVKNKDAIATIKNDSVEAWINVKHLKNFDSSAEFQIKSDKSPVLVYEYGDLVGAILPIRK